MKNLIAILTAAVLVFGVASTESARGADRGGNANAKKPQKSKAPASRPQTAAPKHKSAGPKTNDRSPANTNVSKKELKNANSVQQKNVKQLQKNTDAITNNVNVNRNNVNVNKVTVNRESVARIQAQNVNFRAVPNTAINSVRYNPAYRIAAATNWVGPRYDVFRTYQPVWHDRNYWTSNFARVSLIAGGWYYFNNGYWAPAWGYDESAAYYPYDGPIYAGPSGRPADQVVADVQGVLKEQGYYKGEIDGLVGPQTREALTAYQEAAGLPPTASIDEPTLESLGMAG
jgi:hypothetical protein